MSWQIPNETRYTFRLHSKGIVVWAIQKALRDLGHVLAVDGNYGRKTEGHVATFQEDEGLSSDGIFGPESSQRLAAVLEETIDTPLPAHLIEGFVMGESAGHIGAVNWSVAGGVDCSYLQRRVVSGDYSNDAAIQRAFDGRYQFKLLGWALENRFGAFWLRAGVQSASTLAYIPTREERAWRLASLHHNYQYAADKLSRGPWETAYATSPQDWVIAIGGHNSETGEPISVYFPDGKRVETPFEWCQFYSLGSSEHNHRGSVTRFVEDWTE